MNRLIFVLTFGLFACGASPEPLEVNAQGGVETDPFNAVHAYAGVTVFLRQGDTEKIRVTGTQADLEGLVVETRGTTLHIFYDKPDGVFGIFSSGNTGRNAKIYVQAVELNSVRSSSGAEIQSETPIRADRLSVEASSGSETVLDIEADELRATASSGAEIELSGVTRSATATVSSGAEIDAEAMRARQAELSASSGASVSMRVTDRADARASSGGEVRIYGKPAALNVEESSGGEVRMK